MNHVSVRRLVAGLGLLLVVSTVAACSDDDADPQASNAGSTSSAKNSDGRNQVSTAGRVFSEDSPWNTRIDDADVDPKSATMIELAHERIGVMERTGNLPPVIQRRYVDAGLYINTEAWTPPVVTGGTVTTLECRQVACGDEIPNDELAIPVDINPDPRYDGWFTVIAGDTAYDLWRARRESDDTISYQFSRKWDLNGPGFGNPQVGGARGSGLPLIGGLIRRDELLEGRIQHALAISVPGPAQRVFVPPASTTDGNGRPGSVPEGARLRLKDNVTLRTARDPQTGELIPLTAAQRRTADAIVAALRIYGAIVVDRAAVPTLYAQRDVTDDHLVGNELQGLTLDDFEVITVPTLQRYPAPSTGLTGLNPSATATGGAAS